jgi:protein-tyrosine phosphatase
VRAELTWIPLDGSVAGRLAIAPRPRGGDWLADEVASFAAQGVACIVSLLTREELEEMELTGLEAACAAAGVTWRWLAIPDRGVPGEADAAALAREVARTVREGRGVVVHCRQGIGRSSVIAALAMATLGVPAGEALDRIARARGRPVPDTEEQRRWVGRAAARMGDPEK